MMHLQPDEIEIINAVRFLERQGTKAFPKYVMALYPFKVAEFTLRRKMRDLWLRGWLERPGGANARRGYRVLV
ncbi:MAG: hypothetical protein ACPG7F_00795 [Aggregatilineales bacterium]